MKKWIAAALTAVVVLGAGAVIGIRLSWTDRTEEAETKERTDLTFLTFKRETRHIFEQIIQDFNESQDEVHVKQVIVPNPDEELKIRAIQGDFPDIVEFIGAEKDVFGQYAKGGYLYPITDFSCTDRVYPEFLEKLQIDGELYIMPLSVNYRGLFINQGLMAENGYQIPQTYEELIDVLQEIKDQGETAMVFPDEDKWSIHQGWDAIDTVSRGVQEALFRNAAEGIESMDEDELAVETTEKFLKLREYGPENSLDIGYDEAIKAFANEEAYMFLQGNWAYSLIKKMNPNLDLIFVPFPVEDGKIPNIVVKIDSSLGISSSCRSPEGAEMFLDYLLSDEVVRYYSSEAGAYSCVQMQDATESYDDIFVERLEEGSFEIETSTFFSEIDEERDNLYQKLVRQPESYSVEEFLQELSEMLMIHQQGIIWQESEE